MHVVSAVKRTCHKLAVLTAMGWGLSSEVQPQEARAPVMSAERLRLFFFILSH